jgi:hypothetical protein
MGNQEDGVSRMIFVEQLFQKSTKRHGTQVMEDISGLGRFWISGIVFPLLRQKRLD